MQPSSTKNDHGNSGSPSLAATSKKNTFQLRGGGGSTGAASAAGPAAIPGVGLKSVFTKKHNSTVSPAN